MRLKHYQLKAGCSATSVGQDFFYEKYFGTDVINYDQSGYLGTPRPNQGPMMENNWDYLFNFLQTKVRSKEKWFKSGFRRSRWKDVRKTSSPRGQQSDGFL
jgi:hypothetical protein